jgi:hypothetical protein
MKEREIKDKFWSIPIYIRQQAVMLNFDIDSTRVETTTVHLKKKFQRNKSLPARSNTISDDVAEESTKNHQPGM